MLPLLLLCSGVLFLFLCANAGMHVYELIKLNDGDGGSAPPPVESNDPTCKAVANAVGSASGSNSANTVFGRLLAVTNLLTNTSNALVGVNSTTLSEMASRIGLYGDSQNASSLFGKVNFVRNASERMTEFINTFNATNLLLLAQALESFSNTDGFDILNITKYTRDASNAIGASTDSMANATVFGKLATLMSDVNVSATRVQNAIITAIDVMNSTLRNALTNELSTIKSSASATTTSLASLNSTIGASNDTAVKTSTLFGKLAFIVNEVNGSAMKIVNDVNSTLKSELSNVSSAITGAVSATASSLTSLIGASNDTVAKNTTIFGKLAAVEGYIANSANATTSSLALIATTLAERNDRVNITIGASNDTAETNSTVFGRLAAIARDVNTFKILNVNTTTRIENVTGDVQRLDLKVAYLNESVSRLASATDIGMAFTFTNMCTDTNFSQANCNTSISSWISYNNHSKEVLCFNVLLRAKTVKQADGDFTVPTFQTTLSNNTFANPTVDFAGNFNTTTLQVSEVLVYTDHDSLFHQWSPSCSVNTTFPYLITRHLFAF